MRRPYRFGYPDGLDYAWLACDADGHLARFTTSAEGPIPKIVLANRDRADNAELQLRSLPFVGDAVMKVSLPSPDDFTDLARRGLFGFDWRDALRTAAPTGCYEIVSCPSRVLLLAELPHDLRHLAELVRFQTLRFTDCDSVRVGQFVECA